jgi:hypothetical protein
VNPQSLTIGADIARARGNFRRHGRIRALQFADVLRKGIHQRGKVMNYNWANSGVRQPQ